MEVELKDLPSRDVVYTFASGPYQKSTGEAWAVLGRWIDKKGLNGYISEVVGFGMDNPFTTPAPLIRYVAAFVLSEGRQSDEDANIYEMTIPGGKYAVYRHVGPYSEMAALFRKLSDEWLPASGRKADFTRPFLELYVWRGGEGDDDPPVTELCLPICAETCVL